MILHRPFLSLRENTWFKLICGASYQHLPAIRSLVLAYALAGADCIDVAADPAIVSVAHDALNIAEHLQHAAMQRGFHTQGRPWLMVSLNDGDDPHFRKAAFDPTRCPNDCPRPCEKICPADAIALSSTIKESVGVIRDRCYGCGRCLPVCPIQHIATQSYTTDLETLASSILPEVDAIEIHTQIGRTDSFERVWQSIIPFIYHLKLVAVSCPDGEGLIPYLKALHNVMRPLPHVLVWQTDGRPMSGDIGNGTTHASIRLAQKVLAADLPGYVQLAGGTNAHTVPKLRRLNLLESGNLESGNRLAGVAYGSYARSLLSPLLEAVESSINQGSINQSSMNQGHHLEEYPTLLWQGVRIAHQLVSQLKETIPDDGLPPSTSHRMQSFDPIHPI